jgi:hypothetical protein
MGEMGSTDCFISCILASKPPWSIPRMHIFSYLDVVGNDWRPSVCVTRSSLEISPFDAGTVRFDMRFQFNPSCHFVW